MARGELRPALEGETARDAGRPPNGDERRLDGDGARPAKRIAERLFSCEAGAEKKRGRERLAQRRLCLRPPPASLVQEGARRVDADGTDVPLESGEEELRVRRGLLAGALRQRDWKARPALERGVEPLRHRAGVIQARLAAGDPEGNASPLPQEPLPRERRGLPDQLRKRGRAEWLAETDEDPAAGAEPEVQPHRFAKVALGFDAAGKCAPRKAERPHLRRQDRLQPRRAHREQHRALLYDILWYVARTMRQAKGEQVRRELLPGQSVGLLQELHLIGRDGALHADSLRKLKQVNHLVQLLEPSLRDVLERHPEPVLVDAGAGNAYLGSVLYELFLREHERALIYSVESREDLVERGRQRAARLGFSRMRFVQGAIGEGVPERVHMVLALHACDTATDDALVLALRHDADHVAVVPCCQAEVAAQLKENRHAAPQPWPQLWSHPIHRREMGAHLTNVIRALALQSRGYQVTVTELTGWEHSLKNELILARRVHREHREARAELEKLLETTGVRPKLIRELSG